MPNRSESPSVPSMCRQSRKGIARPRSCCAASQTGILRSRLRKSRATESAPWTAKLPTSSTVPGGLRQTPAKTRRPASIASTEDRPNAWFSRWPAT